MDFKNRKKLGAFIKKLREERELSQSDLAEALNIPRPSVSQMENGQRDLSLEEFSLMAQLFRLSLDDFSGLYAEFLQPQKKSGQAASPKKSPNKKITFSPAKFRQLLLYILEKCGSKPNVGETVLYKLLYFCDFDHFELYGKPLTGMIYKKQQYGPIPSQSLYNPVIKEMAAQNQIRIINVPYKSNFIQRKYVNFLSPDLSFFNPQEIELINKVINRLSDMSARQIEDHVHGDYPWIACEPAEEIPYESVFGRTGEYSQRDEETDFIESGLQDAFGSLGPISKKEYDYYMSLPDKDDPEPA
jgi:transcriptional regulator with XRE-family HTH domain